MIKAVIFDLDGVLVDAVHWHYLAINQALKLFGYEISSQEHSALYNGLPTALKLRILTQQKGFPLALHPLVKDLKQIYTKEIIERSLSKSEKVISMVKYLKARGYKVGVASNSVRETVELMLRQLGVLEYFDCLLSNEDVAQPKPDPEIYRKAFALLKVKPSEVVIIEDSIPGIQAARQASPNVVVVTGPEEVQLDLVQKNIQFFNDHSVEENAHGAPALSPDTIEILIPMAGHGQRFAAAGYKKPKPLIDVLGKPMIQWVVENIKPKNRPSHFTFLVQQGHLKDYPVQNLLSEIAPGCTIVPVPEVTEGAACTALLASQYTNTARPLLIANSDQFVSVDIDDFIREAFDREGDGLIMTFKATHPKWSYAKTDGEGRVTEVAEKNPISENATTGIYFFRHGADFVDGAKRMLKANRRVNREFYICPVYNELVEAKKRIHIYSLAENAMHGMGTPEDLIEFLEWKTGATKAA